MPKNVTKIKYILFINFKNIFLKLGGKVLLSSNKNVLFLVIVKLVKPCEYLVVICVAYIHISVIKK